MQHPKTGLRQEVEGRTVEKAKRRLNAQTAAKRSGASPVDDKALMAQAKAMWTPDRVPACAVPILHEYRELHVCEDERLALEQGIGGHTSEAELLEEVLYWTPSISLRPKGLPS